MEFDGNSNDEDDASSYEEVSVYEEVEVYEEVLAPNEEINDANDKIEGDLNRVLEAGEPDKENLNQQNCSVNTDDNSQAELLASQIFHHPIEVQP